MKISHRLISGNIVIIVLVIAIGIFGLLSRKDIVRSFESSEKHFRSIITAATEASSYAKRTEGHLILFLTLQNPEDRDKFYERHNSLLEEIKVMDLAVNVPVAREYVEKIKVDTARLLSAGESLLKAYDRDMAVSGRFSPSGHEAEIRAFNDITSSIRQNSVELAIAEAVLSEDAHRTALKKAASFQIYGFVIIFGGVIVALVLGYVLSRKIAQPILELKDNVAEVSRGNLDVTMNHASKDEIGELTDSFNMMTKALRDSQQGIISEKERLLVTLRSIGDGVITTDTDGRVVLVNTVAENLTGWKQQDAAGRPLQEIFHIMNEKTRELCENPVEKVMRTGKIVGPVDHTVIIGRNGVEKTIADSGAPILDESGKMIGAVLVFRDITEKQRMERELLKARNIESLGILAGGIAHDFNNILVGILGNISLAKRKLEREEKEKIMDRLTGVEHAAIRAKELAHQLLTFSKGGEPLLKTTSINGLIMDSAKFVLAGSNVICSFLFPDDLWLVDIDRGQLSQVIHNLIINAKWAMPEGGKIEIQAENIVIDERSAAPVPLPAGSYIRISLQDEGIGIPVENLHKIFDPYFTTRGKGSGLGLATAYSIMKRHQGLITAEPAAEQGTTFHLYLPASDKPVSAEIGQVIFEAGKGKVLLMDDDEIVRDVTQAMLVDLGYETVLSKNGTEAVARYQEARRSGQPFAAIILDLTIPGGMGGQETLQEILKIDPDVRAIVASGYSEDPVMAEFGRYGFRDVLKKPFGLQEIGSALQKVMG
ncbi:MAG: PAS domain S-box protein [Nitrospirae bacterium]|nr:PAS domain S-box protein [Nitrospirota bacterium]